MVHLLIATYWGVNSSSPCIIVHNIVFIVLLLTILVVQVEHLVGCVCMCLFGQSLLNKMILTLVFVMLVHLDQVQKSRSYVKFYGDRRENLEEENIFWLCMHITR